MFKIDREPYYQPHPSSRDKQLGKLELANRIQEVLDTDQANEVKIESIREILTQVFRNEMNSRIAARGIIQDPSLLERIGNKD